MSSLHSHDWVATTENSELLEQVRLRLYVATLASEILPEYASLGEILALAEWLRNGAGAAVVNLLDSEIGEGPQ